MANNRNNASKQQPAPLISGDFLVASTPHADLVYTNYVYLANLADDAASSSSLSSPPPSASYVLVNNTTIYLARTHSEVSPNTIALSSVQRETSGKLQIGQPKPCSVKQWLPPNDGSLDLVTLKLEVELVAPKRTSLSADDLIPFLREMYSGHVFTRGQVFASNFSGTALKFRVEDGEARVPLPPQKGEKKIEVVESKKNKDADESDDESEDDDDSAADDPSMTRSVQHGLLLSHTHISITSSPSAETARFFQFKPSAPPKPSLLSSKFNFKELGIGGLDEEFATMFRDAFTTRVYSAKEIESLGVKHVKGMLLYGPPGTGKTLIARQIGAMLSTVKPKLVNGPEILSKWMGNAEAAIRLLFKEAIEDQEANGDNANLHIIIFDEIDSIAAARGSGGESSGNRDTIVNQLLTMIDGVKSLNNIFVIGMTNRKDMIDPALLRAGRLEMHLKISLPDRKGREQIFKIHTKKMKESGKLGEDVDLIELAKRTKNFSGGEIETLVRRAAAFALFSKIDMKKKPTEEELAKYRIVVTMDHFLHALSKLKPMFGMDEELLENYLRTPLISYSSSFEKIFKKCMAHIKEARSDVNTRLMTLLLTGVSGTGKTSIAAKLAQDSGIPYVKVIAAHHFDGVSETKKLNDIKNAFESAYQSPLSLIILDSLEQLIEWDENGPRYSSSVMQLLQGRVGLTPPPSCKLIVLATSSEEKKLPAKLVRAFHFQQAIAPLKQPKEVETVLKSLGIQAVGGDAGLAQLSLECPLPIPIRQLMRVAHKAAQDSVGVVSSKRFQECLAAYGLIEPLEEEQEVDSEDDM